MKPSLTTLKTLLLALLIAVGVSYASAAWQPAPGGITPNCPTDTADTNYREGCNPPINVSATAQIKKGDLALGLLATSPNTTLDIFGKMKVASDAIFLGKIGIGTVSPTQKLDVSGTVKATGLQITTGAGAGRVLTSNAAGNATWKSVLNYSNLPPGVSAGLCTGQGVVNEGNANMTLKEVIAPAIFSSANGGSCTCPAGWNVVKTAAEWKGGSTAQRFYSCLKQ